MPQAEAVEFDFPPAPTPGEYVFALSLLWLVGLAMITGGAYGLYRSKNDLVKLLATVSLALGFGHSLLLAFSFSSCNHRKFDWSPGNPNVSFWIDICLSMIVLGTPPLFFWIGRKLGKREV